MVERSLFRAVVTQSYLVILRGIASISCPILFVTHRTLLSAIWGGQSTEQVENLRVVVGQLRKKLEPETSSPRYIVTEPLVGYRFEPRE